MVALPIIQSDSSSSVRFSREYGACIPGRCGEGAFPAGAAVALLELNSDGRAQGKRRQTEIPTLACHPDLRLSSITGLEPDPRESALGAALVRVLEATSRCLPARLRSTRGVCRRFRSEEHTSELQSPY